MKLCFLLCRLGFETIMAKWMGASDCIITKVSFVIAYLLFYVLLHGNGFSVPHASSDICKSQLLDEDQMTHVRIVIQLVIRVA